MPTNLEIERKNHRKETLQPFKKKNSKVVVNEEFVKEYGTDAYEDGTNNDIKEHYSKRLAKDPKLIHSNNTVVVTGLKFDKKKKAKKSTVCKGTFDADGNGGLKEPCTKCGKKSFEHKNLY